MTAEDPGARAGAEGPGGREGAAGPEARARACLEEVLAEVAPDARLEQVPPGGDLRRALDLDSYDFLALLTGMSERLGVEVPERDFGRVCTVEGLVGYFSRLPGAPDPPAAAAPPPGAPRWPG